MKRKRPILHILLPLILCAAPTSAQTFQIAAQISTEADTLYAICDKPFRRDTIVASHGRFSLTYTIDNITSITIARTLHPMPSDDAIRLTAVPGEKVIIKGNFDYHEFSGSRFYEEYNLMRLMLANYSQRNNTNIRWSTMLRERNIDNDTVHTVFTSIRTDNTKRLEQASKQYIMLHPDEECSALLISNIMDVHEARRCYDALTPRVRNGRMAETMARLIEHADKEIARLKRAEKVKPGLPAPLFALKDIKGKTLKLESLRGKWIILDFWGSWCFWCINGVPQMRNYYEKYKGKFEFLSIDCNDTEKAWRDAVAKNNMPWMHVTDPTRSNATGTELENSIVYRYAIKGFPTKVIIRPDGIIDNIFVGEKEDFYHYLDKLFQ